MTKPQEKDYTSHVAYARALEEYCWKLEHLHLSAERCASDLSKGCAKLEGERDALAITSKILMREIDGLNSEIKSLKLDAELGRIAMRFVDRAGDYCDVDPAERICDQFYKAMLEAAKGEAK